MNEKLIINWDDYNRTVEKLAIQIDESGYKPTILIGIMRGAAPMIDVLSRIFKLKCAYLAVESYSGKGVEDEQGDIVFSREMSRYLQIWEEGYYFVMTYLILELLLIKVSIG